MGAEPSPCSSCGSLVSAFPTELPVGEYDVERRVLHAGDAADDGLGGSAGAVALYFEQWFVAGTRCRRGSDRRTAA